ncbi:MAG: beta-galactosidase [Fervidobacterium sp.]
MKIYGSDYYPEHWDESIWYKHIQLMKKYGVEWVRIGEFAWSVVEPKEGAYDFSVLDKAISKLKENGIKIILGTPTATPPAWLIRKYPEILPVDYKGQLREFGSRRHYSTNSKVYREYAIRITEEYAKRYGKEIDIWQIDNEFGCHSTTYSFNEDDRRAFIQWLKDRYKTLDNLNKSWGTVFWSQVYNDWEQIVFPINTPTFENPHQMLDIYRFMSDSSIDFMNLQINVIRKYSDKPITHNFMVDFMDIDYRKMSEILDFVSWDNYIATVDYDPLRQSANHTLMRSLKKAPFLVIEQQPGRVNWREVNENYGAEYLGMWIKQGFLNGAFGVMPFRFDQIRFGAEQYHGGLVDYAGRKTKRLEEFNKVKSETLGVLEPKREVAVYFSYENEWIHRINHVNRKFKYWDSVVDIFKSIRNLGYNVDFVFDDDDIQDYKVLIVPYAFKISNAFVEKIKKFKGTVYITCMSGLKDEQNWIVERSPQGLIEEVGIEVMDFGAVNKCSGFIFNQKIEVGYWKDEIEVFDANVIGIFEDGSPLVTEKHGRFYITGVLDEDGWKKLLSYSLNPKFVGIDVEFSEAKNSEVYVLNLRNSKNIIYMGNKKIEFAPFELKKL